VVKRFFALLIVVLPLLAACVAQPGAGGNPVAYGTTGARMVSDSAATIQAATAIAMNHQMEATRQAQAATVQAQEIANATMGVMIVTRNFQDMQQRDLELSGMATATAIANSGTAMAVALAGTREANDALQESRLVAQEAAARATIQAQEIKRNELQNSMRAYWVAAVPWIVVVVVVVTFAAVMGWLLIRGVDARRPPVYSMPVRENSVSMLKGPNGWTVVPQMSLPAPPVEDGEFYESTTPANWAAFTKWQHATQIPIGATVDGQRQPVLVDRNVYPHLLFAGKSGAGKTRSGLIPAMLALWGGGAHVVVINGKGSDVNIFRNVPNFTVFPAMDESELITPLSDFMDTLVREMTRRDEILARYNAATWRDLPPGTGEPGEIVIAIDEFLAIAQSAKDLRLAIMASREFTSSAARKQAADEVTFTVGKLWTATLKLAQKARKHGIHLVITVADPTKDSLGDEGMALRRQALPVGYRMSEDAGRKFLGLSRGEYPRGTVGFPSGQFLVNMDGEIKRAVSFYPSVSDIQQFIQARAPLVHENNLPPALLADGVVTGSWSDVRASAALPQNNLQSAVERDAQLIQGKLFNCRSRTAVGRLLAETRGDLTPGVNPSTKQIEDGMNALKHLADNGDIEARTVWDIISP